MIQPVFTTQTRDRLNTALIAKAHADVRVTAAAVVGSASVGREDRWSDIDLALGLAEDADMAQVIADWSDALYREHGAVHHLDVWRGVSCIRVFLLADTLQVDIAFRPKADFRATGPTFKLLFGKASEHPLPDLPDPAELVGLGWVYALHVRSSLRRRRVWQAEWMLAHVREQVLALACLRHGLPAYEGRGTDALPSEVTDPLRLSFPRSLDVAELKRAFRVTCDALLKEIGYMDNTLLEQLRDPVKALSR